MAFATQLEIRMARMEGAATDLKEFAGQLKEETRKANEKRKLQNIAEIEFLAEKLDRYVISARLAFEQLKKE